MAAVAAGAGMQNGAPAVRLVLGARAIYVTQSQAAIYRDQLCASVAQLDKVHAHLREMPEPKAHEGVIPVVGLYVAGRETIMELEQARRLADDLTVALHHIEQLLKLRSSPLFVPASSLERGSS